MIRVRQVKVNIDEDLKKATAHKLHIKENDILMLKIVRKSLDARKKSALHFVYEVDIKARNEREILKQNKSHDVLKTPQEIYKFAITGMKKMQYRPIIVGSGPAGLFCAYMLASYGYRPIIIERGEAIEQRVLTVDRFWQTGDLNPESNVQFGEGGAGTFSDGKLNTLVKDKSFRMQKVFEIFLENGAPSEIMYENKPHIGTDKLREVIKNMREQILTFGGEFRYQTCLTEVLIEKGELKGIVVNNTETILCDTLVLALGHSARDTFVMLEQKGLAMEAKPFAVGIRIIHAQAMINKAQYGILHDRLEPASYKLTYTAPDKRGVYSFCMCPGGYVVNASSEFQRLAINGMSNYKRDSESANSAIVVTVGPDDFGNGPLAGLKYQQDLEKQAYKIASGKIPVQLFGDFDRGVISTNFGKVKPLFKGAYQFADLNKILPDYISQNLKLAIKDFGHKIKGFANKDAIIAGIESRTSSPVRIIRDENYMANIKGIYPCGEGAGYAGGITTSAMDGLKVAEALATIYKS